MLHRDIPGTRDRAIFLDNRLKNGDITEEEYLKILESDAMLHDELHEEKLQREAALEPTEANSATPRFRREMRKVTLIIEIRFRDSPTCTYMRIYIHIYVHVPRRSVIKRPVTAPNGRPSQETSQHAFGTISLACFNVSHLDHAWKRLVPILRC